MNNFKKVFGNSVIIFCTLFLLNGCSSPNTDNNKNQSAKEVTSQAPDTVVIQQMQFVPEKLDVKVGDTVVWINKDLVDHDVTADNNNAFYSDTLKVGKEWKMVIKDSGSYHCSIHPSMKGSLLIK